jgi:hypothetical protein
MSQPTPSATSCVPRIRVFHLFSLALLIMPLAAILAPLSTSDQDHFIHRNHGFTTDVGSAVPVSQQVLAATPNSAIRYLYTFTSEAGGNNPDFSRWGGDRSTSCGTNCAYYQSLVNQYGNPQPTFDLWLIGVNGQGGAGPRQNGVSLSTATNFEYSADFYVYNGQLDARYGLAFDATSGTFPGSATPPMDPSANYYLLELRMDAVTRTKVAKWQFLRIVNGARQALTTVANLPISISQGEWHNLKVTQRGTTMSFYLNGQFIASTSYDSSWGDDRRRFGLYIDVRATNGENGPFEFFADNVMVADLDTSIGIALDGPDTDLINTTVVFTATATMLTPTAPITYTWQASDESPVIHTTDLITDLASFAWTTPGTKTITVTALSALGVATATHSIEIESGTAPRDLEIIGPQTGAPNVAHAFTATTAPITMTAPITYVWEATDQSPVTHTSELVTDTMSFAWTQAGTKMITVTASNMAGTVTAMHFIEVGIEPASITLDGLQSGVTQASYTFTATTAPISITTPITYLWQATDQTPVIHTSDLTTGSVTFTWTISGTKVVTVIASNTIGSVTTAHVIEVKMMWRVFLPIVLNGDSLQARPY